MRLLRLLAIGLIATQANATNFGTVVPKGANFASQVVAANNALGVNTVRANMPLVTQLTNQRVGTTYYIDQNVNLQNTISGSTNGGSFTTGDQLLQDNTNAAATLNAGPSGGSITVSAVGQPLGNAPDASSNWVDQASGATFVWTPSALPAVVPTYTAHLNATPTGWAAGDTVTSYALSADGSAPATSQIASIAGQLVTLCSAPGGSCGAGPFPSWQVGIVSPSDGLSQLTQAAGGGFLLHAVMFNSCSPAINTNCPIRTPAEYTYQLTQTLSTICTVTGKCLRSFAPESEMDAFYGAQAGPAQYLAEAALAVSIGHSLGYIVYSGAPATTGLNAWWWYCTFYGSCGFAQNQVLATANAPGLFVKTSKQADWANNQIPTSCNLAGTKAGGGIQATSGWTGSIDANGVMTITGNLLSGTIGDATTSPPADVVYAQGQPVGVTVVSRISATGGTGTYQLSAGSVPLPSSPIYMNALSPGKFRNLRKAYQIIAGYSSVPFDFANYHWYQTSPIVEVPVLTAYLASSGRKPLALEENGTYSMSGQDVSDHLTGARTFNPDMIMWWNNDAGDGSGAVALLNSDLSLRPNGSAFKAFISNSPPAAPLQLGAAIAPRAPPC